LVDAQEIDKDVLRQVTLFGELHQSVGLPTRWVTSS
jgi:hypothetical protein